MVSTSICNECVLNINSFYTFKKRILEAQELINSLPQTNEHHNLDSGEEIFEENDEFELELELNGEEGDDDEEYEIHQIENVSSHDETNEEHLRHDVQMESSSSQESAVVVRSTLLDNANKRPKISMVSASSPSKLSHKKAKLSTQLETERFTLQMNECLICPAVLNDILKLKDHIDSHEQIECKVCHRQFVRYSNLKRHFNAVHSKPKPFICDICGLGFNFSVNLQQHASLHYSGKIQNET